MTVIVNDNESQVEARGITIVVDEVEFTIRVNRLKELIIVKTQFGQGEDSISIKPNFSNEIILT